MRLASETSAFRTRGKESSLRQEAPYDAASAARSGIFPLPSLLCRRPTQKEDHPKEALVQKSILREPELSEPAQA